MTNRHLQLNSIGKAVRGFIGGALKDFHRDIHNRLLSYLLFFSCFFLLGIAAWTLVRGLDILFAKMAFITVYTLHAALAYTFGLWLAEVILSQGKPAWAGYKYRTVGRQWAVWLGGYILGVLMHRHLVKEAVALYAPSQIWFRTSPPDPSLPWDLYFFLGGLSVWLITAGLLISWVWRRQSKMAGLSRMEISLAAQGRPEPTEVLRIKAGGKDLAIPHVEISHITVEDHYLRIFHGNNGSTQNVFFRHSLNKLMKRLPERHFLRIHRSHVVNLRQVAKLEKHGKGTHLRLHSFDQTLPVSRHRLRHLRPRLENALTKGAG